MTGSFESHLRRDEWIAAEVELYRQTRFPPAARLGAAARSKPLYPVWVYSPSESFLRRLASSRRA